jgi:hypothetical protein
MIWRVRNGSGRPISLSSTPHASGRRWSAIVRSRHRSPRDRGETVQDLRHDLHGLAAAVSDRDTRAALRWALIDTGQATRAGSRWLHYLRDHPAVLRKTIDWALENDMLRRDAGRPGRLDRVLLVEGVSGAYEILTGKPLGRTATIETKVQRGGRPTGPGLRRVSVCLKPFDAHITAGAVAWAIRAAQARLSGPPR